MVDVSAEIILLFDDPPSMPIVREALSDNFMFFSQFFGLAAHRVSVRRNA